MCQAVFVEAPETQVQETSQETWPFAHPSALPSLG